MEYKYVQHTHKATQNVNGQYMTLGINKFQCGYELTITTDWSHTFQIKILLLILLIIIGLFDYKLNILITYYCVLFLVICMIVLYQLKSILKLEKLLVVKHVGLQIEEYYLLGNKRTFIPWSLIDAIFINEVIMMQRVLFILTVKTKDKDNNVKLFPLFKMTKPRLADIKVIYRLLKEL